MKHFEYNDQFITEKEIAYAVPSMVIGVGILTLPRLLANTTNTDGYLSLLIAGGAAILLTWLVASLPSRFPGQSFFSYTGLIISKPVSFILTISLSLYFLFTTAYIVRMVSMIAKQYLFDMTPLEVIALLFFIVVIYAVAGRRVGVLRLNMMFVPIILVISFLVILLNVGMMKFQNMFPFFKTGAKDIMIGAFQSHFAFAGAGILLFYVSLVRKPNKVPKYAGLSMMIPIILYLTIHVVCVLVFSYRVTGTLIYPTIELAKEVQIPGGFFERFESIFFTVWIMAIFTTATMAFDISVMALSSLRPKWKKMTWIYILAPVVYILAMSPQNFNAVSTIGQYISYAGLALTQAVPIFLLIIAKIRGVKGNETGA